MSLSVRESNLFAVPSLRNIYYITLYVKNRPCGFFYTFKQCLNLFELEWLLGLDSEVCDNK